MEKILKIPNSKLFFKQKIIILIAGAILPFNFAPYNYYLVFIPSIIILFHFWQNSNTKKQSFVIGYLYGFGFFATGTGSLIDVGSSSFLTVFTTATS